MRKLLLSGVILLALVACNKEPADIGTVSEDYDLSAAINELPVAQDAIDSKGEEETNDAKETDKSVSDEEDIKPSETFGVDDKAITDFRAGVFVPGSLPLADLYDSSLTSQVEFTKNGNNFDVLFNYYKDGNKLVAQYECPQAIKGNSFVNYFNTDVNDKYRKECLIKKQGDKYIVASNCKPHLYCQGPNVKLHIFENFLDESTSTNKLIKTFEVKNNNPCQNARKLYKVSGEGNLDQVKEFLSKTDVNTATSSETEPFFQWEDAMVLALDRPLLNAITSNHAEIVEMLLKNRADPNLSNIESEYYPFVDGGKIWDGLGWSVKTKNEEIINLILPKIKSKGDSLLAAACYGNNNVVESILKEDSSTINKKRLIAETYYTPLSCALSFYREKYTPQHREVVKTLVAYGVDVNQPSPAGQDPGYCTPLQLAVEDNDVEIAKLLIDNGADVNLNVRSVEKHDDGHEFFTGFCSSALEIAERKENTEMVRLLSDAGAVKDAKPVVIDVTKSKDEYNTIVEFLKSYKSKE